MSRRVDLMSMHVCTGCRLPKPAGAFSADRRRPGGLQSRCHACVAAHVRDYVRLNKTKVVAANREWYKNNADSVKAKSRAHYHARPRAESRAVRAKWRLKNKAAVAVASLDWYYRNKNKCRAAAQRYAKKFPEKQKARVHRRRARVKNAPGAFNADQIKQVVSLFGGKCAYCGGAYEAIDHVVPLSRGGTNYIANIRPCCTTCNSSKGSKLLSEWPGRRYG